MPRGRNRERNRGDHKCDSRPSGSFREGRGAAARAKCSLTSHATEGGRNVAALATLQEHDNNQENADQNMQDSN